MRRLLLLASVIGVLAAPSAAGGALVQNALTDPGSGQYQSEAAGTESAAAENEDEPSGLNSEIGGLPFTGLDLIVLAGIALVLTGTGFALHRLSEPKV